MTQILCAFIQVYLIVVIARALLSWFPIEPNSKLMPVQRILFDLTEPVVAPMRRVIPPAGNFDLSFLVLTFVLIMLRTAICG